MYWSEMNKETDDGGKDDDGSEKRRGAQDGRKRKRNDVRKYILKSVESPEWKKKTSLAGTERWDDWNVDFNDTRAPAKFADQNDMRTLGLAEYSKTLGDLGSFNPSYDRDPFKW